MRPRVLLLQPASYSSRQQDFGVPHLLALAGWVERKAEAEPVVRDLRHERDPDAALREAIEESRPAVIGVSCYASFDYLDAVATARKTRAAAPDARIVVGGYHASACPEDFTLHPDVFDHVVVGDGERALAEIVRSAVGDAPRPAPVMPPGRPVDPEEMPPYPFRLLERYVRSAGRGRAKLQINLSRGCPHSCAFCMERAKPDRVWRAASPERAMEELRRLDRVFPLREHLLHVTDPLFGMKASWRRRFLGLLAASDLRPRSIWALTRAEGLDEEDVRLYSRCRFAIGLGLESGSPEMLRVMRKTGQPGRYLDGFLRLRDLAGRAGATWAVNVLVGHPGETDRTIDESLAFLDRLFPPGEPSRGWLSVDPFRLYPGSDVHRRIRAWEEAHGAAFHAPSWWREAAARDVSSELVDPSRSLDAFGRLAATYTRYRATVMRVCDSFRCDDEQAAPIFARSLEEQRDAFSVEAYERRHRVFSELHPAARLPQGAPRPVTVVVDRFDGDEAFARSAARALCLGPGSRCAVVGNRDAAVENALRPVVGAGGTVGWIPPRPGPLGRLVARISAAARRGAASGKRAGASPLALSLRARAAGVDVAIVLGAHHAVPRGLLAWIRSRRGRSAAVAVGPRFAVQRALLLSAAADGIRRRTFATGRLPPARGEAGWID